MSGCSVSSQYGEAAPIRNSLGNDGLTECNVGKTVGVNTLPSRKKAKSTDRGLRRDSARVEKRHSLR